MQRALHAFRIGGIPTLEIVESCLSNCGFVGVRNWRLCLGLNETTSEGNN
jgi:hypothetical protein